MYSRLPVVKVCLTLVYSNDCVQYSCTSTLVFETEEYGHCMV